MQLDNNDFQHQLYTEGNLFDGLGNYMIDSFVEVGYCEDCDLHAYSPEYQRDLSKQYARYGDWYQWISICMECKRVITLVDTGLSLEYAKTKPGMSLLYYFNALVIDRILLLKNNHLSKHLWHGQYRKSLLDKRIEEIKIVYQLLFEYKKEIGMI